MLFHILSIYCACFTFLFAAVISLCPVRPYHHLLWSQFPGKSLILVFTPLRAAATNRKWDTSLHRPRFPPEKAEMQRVHSGGPEIYLLHGAGISMA